jgi:hypothetical protein
MSGECEWTSGLWISLLPSRSRTLCGTTVSVVVDSITRPSNARSVGISWVTAIRNAPLHQTLQRSERRCLEHCKFRPLRPLAMAIAVNPPVRFDEGEGSFTGPSVLYGSLIEFDPRMFDLLRVRSRWASPSTPGTRRSRRKRHKSQARYSSRWKRITPRYNVRRCAAHARGGWLR